MFRVPGTIEKTDSKFQLEKGCLEDDPFRILSAVLFFFLGGGGWNVLDSERWVVDLTNRFVVRWRNVMNHPLFSSFFVSPVIPNCQMHTVEVKPTIKIRVPNFG